jgi:hypothetical protein
VELLRSLAVNLTPELVLLQQGRDPQRGALNPAAMRLDQEVAEDAWTLPEPKALLDLLDVQAV